MYLIGLEPGSSATIGTIQRRLAWPLRKDDTYKSRMYRTSAKYVLACISHRIEETKELIDME